MGTKPVRGADRLQQGGIHLGRIQGGEAQPGGVLQGQKLPNQAAQAGGRVQARAVPPQVNSGQDDLPVPGPGQVPGRLQSQPGGQGAGGPPGQPDPAVGADIVAAVLDLEQGPGPAPLGQGSGQGPELPEALLPANSGHPGQVLPQDLLEPALAGRAQDQINPFDFFEALGLQLGQATGHDQAGPGVLPAASADKLAGLLVGPVGHGAGVDHHHGRVMRRFGIPQLLH